MLLIYQEILYAFETSLRIAIVYAKKLLRNNGYQYKSKDINLTHILMKILRHPPVKNRISSIKTKHRVRHRHT